MVSWTAPTKPTTQNWSDFRLNWAKADENYPSYTETSGNAEPGANERSHTIENLEAGEEYKVRIRARYSTDWSGPWKEATITVPALVSAQQADAALVLSHSSLTITEGDGNGASYTVRLGSQPTSPVTVTVSGHDGSDLSLSGLTGNALMFTTSDWDTEQTVTRDRRRGRRHDRRHRHVDPYPLGRRVERPGGSHGDRLRQRRLEDSAQRALANGARGQLDRGHLHGEAVLGSQCERDRDGERPVGQ